MAASEMVNLIIGLLGIIAAAMMFWSLPVPSSASRDESNLPFLSIIIPARNEAGRIAPLLSSLQKQNLRSFEVIVVDDHSTDDTAGVAKSYGAAVLHNEKEGSGSGKSMACWHGAQHAKGKWLLFLDADTYFTEADSLQSLLSHYQQKGARGILSIQPYHTVHRLYENLSAVFNIVVIAGMNTFTYWGDRFEIAGSFGPCILSDKDDYFSTGGHKQIQEALMDDLALGQAFLGKNLPVSGLGGKGIISLRMYPDGLKDLIEGWCKSFALGSKSTHPVVMLMVIIWISGSLTTAAALISSVAAADPVSIALSAGLYILYAVQTAYFARRCGNFRWIIFLFYPVLFLFFSGVYAYSLFRVYVLRSVKWKDRKIDV